MPQGFLSILPATPRARRLALGVVLLSGLVFAAAAPFAKLPLTPVPAFLPVYQSALVIVELMTALLLFGQFSSSRARPVLVLAGAFLFSACMAVVHLLSFPGLFAPTGLLAAGPQTTAWLYFLWHGGFPLLVLGYALLKRRQAARSEARGGAHAVLWTIAAVLALVGALILLVTAGHGVLPVVMQGNTDAPAKLIVATATWVLCLAALIVLWGRRSPSLLDLWLMVVVCVWIFEVALAAVLNGARFDLGWYAGRVYGLFAASFVLAVLLRENGVLYARLWQAQNIELEQARRSLARHAERLRLLREIDRAVLAEQTPDAIAAAVIQPLRELLGVPRAIVNRIDLAAGEVEWVAAAGRRRTHVGPGVRYSLALMGDVAALRRGESQLVDVHKLPQGPETQALLSSDVQVYMAVPMIAGGELLGAISFGGSANIFPPEQVAIAQEVAAQLAIATSQARLLGRVKGQAAELELRVRERTAELEAANKELSSFSYSVSHDLRAPLRAVDGYALMLEEDHGARLDDEGRRLIGVVRESSRRMGQLIDDLLAFSRLGRQALVKHPVDMAALARETIDEARAFSTAASVELASMPQAEADRSLMKQVWSNLISNAFKYSSKRSDARIEIGGREEGARAVYWVRDNGAGFDMRYAEKLFGVFQRLHRQDEFPGTGVGLAIVQRVVSRHGGEVWAEGRPGEGASFFFSLPVSA